MEVARHQRIKELFDAACSAPGSERFAFVARECGGDEAMRRELESLLAFYDDGGEPVDGRPRRVRARRDREGGRRTIAGRYRIERRLGAGGMGEVYAAYDGLMREEVALKLFPHADNDQRRRLVEEVRLARLVTHPAVCRVYDLGEDAGTVFLTMELIDGEDLAGRLSRSGALPSSEVASIGRTLCDALAAAHEAGVLHRDLKPSNVLIGRDGKVHIADFGIATRNSAPDSGESAERRFGTLAYIAPEETIGGVATQQTDLYSLGLVLYELLTGAPAFEAADRDTLLELRRSARIERPSNLVPDADADLEALILQLLEDDPAQRPESARGVATALGGLTLAAPGEPAAEPERRQIVALSCELEARPDLVAGGRWAEIVRTFQARCSASCRRRGGQVARHLPRGLLVYFGLPRRAEHDAEQAVQAGLEILADLSARPLLATGTMPPAVSIAVDAPVVSVRGRNVVSRGRTITEPSPGATRSSAVSDRVVVTGAVQPLLRGSFVTTSLASSGSTAEPSYLVSQAPQPVVLTGDGVRLTPFVGRELELERLARCWRDARSGSGQIALVSGESGIGKTRIVRELWQRVREDGGTLYEARCSSLHSHTPLHPFVEMVSQLAGLSPEDDDETRTAKLRRTVAPFGARADSLLGVFSAWLPIGPSTARAPSTRHDRRAAIAAIEDCVVTLSELHPLVLVCEDLHWSDPTTREAIERLVDGVRTARILLVLTFRRDFEPRWSGTGIHHLALQPLREEEARGMVSLFPEVEGRPEIMMRTDELVDRADGNPLFLEELTRHALETAGTSQQQSVPGSLKGLLSARLDRLGSARRLAQAASVCGRSVSYLVLAGLVSETESVQFENDLSRLIDGEILLQRGPSTRATFTFRHALLREAAYEALPLRERRRLHALAARALPELDPQSVSQPELVASHWAAAKQDDLAFSWWRRAGFLALERSAYAEAKYHLERALRALPSAIAEAERDEQKLEIELALTALEAGRNGPGSNEAARHARRAEALCAKLPAGDQVARALMLSGRVRYGRGEMRTALRMLEPLWAVEDTIADPYLRAAVLTQAGNLLSTLGRLEESERFQERAIATYARAEQRPAGAFTTDPLAHLMVTRAADDWLRGRATQSRRWLDAAIEHADRLAHPFTRALVRMLGASLAWRQGDRELSSRLLEEGAALAVAVESSWLINMAEVYSPVLDHSLPAGEAARRIEDALDRTSGSWVLRSLQWSELARLFENAGRPEDATRAMDRALREARRRDRSLVPEILRRRGELMVRRRDRPAARAALRSAVKLARHERTFGLELLCVLSLAWLLLDEGRADEARRVLAATLAHLPDDVTAPERAQAAALLAGIASKPSQHGPGAQTAPLPAS